MALEQAPGTRGWGALTRWSGLWSWRALLLLVLLVARGAEAADPYAAPDILVDVQTSNPVAAREQALTRAPETAARQLFDRLVLREHRGRLTQLDPATLSVLVRGIDVHDERVSPQRYTARIVVVFDRALTRTFLQDQGVGFADVPGKPILIVPVFGVDGALRLWEPDNPWRAAWAKLAAAHGQQRRGLVPLVLPRGDLDDQTVIDAAQAAGGNRDRLRQLGQYYNLAEVMVVRASQSVDAAGGTLLAVGAIRYGALPAPVDHGSRSVSQGVDETDTLMARAVHMVIADIEEAWRQSVWLASKQRAELTVRVPLASIEDLALVRQRLGEVRSVLEQELLTLNRREALLRVRYSGSREQFRAQLGEAKLAFEGAGDDGLLVPSEAAPRREAPRQ
jgi:Uncharacterized protein conserved in bacteria (DUF2066)